MFRILIGFLLFVFLTIIGLAISLGTLYLLADRTDSYAPNPVELWLPPAFALLLTALLLFTWRRPLWFHLLYFTGLLLLGLAAACVIVEWGRIVDQNVYDLGNWPTPPNFPIFGKFLTLFVVEYAGVAFLSAALWHEKFVKPRWIKRVQTEGGGKEG